MEPRKVQNPEADVLDNTEDNMGRCDSASTLPLRRGHRPWHVRKLFAWNREVSGLTGGWTPQVRIGKARSRSW